MIKFSASPIWFKNTGLSLLCGQLLLFIFALYPFQFGTWFNTEPAMVALFAFGTFNALWLACGIYKQFLVLELPVHPLIYGLLAWVGLQFIALPFAQNSFISWMGIPQTGEGGAWQVMLALLTFTAMPLWENSQNSNLYKKILLAVGLFSLCAMSYLHFNPKVFCLLANNYVGNNPATPANWADYLVFIAAWLWIAYASVPSFRTPSRHFWMITIVVGAIFLTNCKSAGFLIIPMFVAIGIILRLQLLRKKPAWVTKIIKPSKIWRIFAIVGIFLPLFWVGIGQYEELFPCKNHSLPSRAVFSQAIISTLEHEPAIFITGHGWGEFSNDMFKYGMVDGLYSFKNGIYQPNCWWLAGNVFHTHNQPMEALLALGLLGFALFMALPILAFLPLRKSLFWWCVPVLIGINAVGFTWFTLPQVLPFEALGLAALCAGRPAKLRKIAILPNWLAIISAALAILLAISSWQQVKEIMYGERLANIIGEDPNQAGIMDFMAEDISRGGDRLLAGLHYYAENISQKVAEKTANERDRDWYRNFLEVARIAATSPYANAKLVKMDVELSMIPFRLMQDSPIDELKPKIKETLVDSIIRVSKIAPEREDFIAPFLMSLDGLTKGDTGKQREILERIIAVAPNHRSALWLLGNLYETSPDLEIRQKGEEMKTRAIELGIDRVYPRL